jgi:para-nitrobenzyl esterase
MGRPAARDTDGDWLTVNVWSPDLGAARLPVMVWIHGGGYVYGWSGDPLFDGAVLARDGVVVVTFNYRLSAEGFGHFPGAPANRGLLDQVAALRWVQDNIAAFGGDPERVTVFGESAGAGSIAALMVMPSATGLFHRAIAQSVPGLYFTEALATDIAAAITGHLGLPPSARELARLSPSRLNDAADEVAGKMAANPRWGQAAHLQAPFAPVVDGEVLPAVPWQALAGGAASGVELIVGHTRDEYRLFMAVKGELGEITPEQTDAALRVLAADPGAYRADQQGNLRSVNDPGQQIAPVNICATPVLRIGRLELGLGQCDRRISGKGGPNEDQQNDRQQKGGTDYRRTIPFESPPGALVWTQMFHGADRKAPATYPPGRPLKKPSARATALSIALALLTVS